jgi:hypothetical protein
LATEPGQKNAGAEIVIRAPHPEGMTVNSIRCAGPIFVEIITNLVDCQVISPGGSVCFALVSASRIPPELPEANDARRASGSSLDLMGRSLP